MTRGWSAWLAALSFLVTGVLTTPGRAAAAHQPRSEAAEQSADSDQTSNHDISRRNIDEPENFTGGPESPINRETHLNLQLLENMVSDQKAIWASPKNLRFVDADWLLPLGIATGGMFATDTEYSKHLSDSPSRFNSSESISNYGIGSLIGIDGGFYFWGRMTHDDHEQETSILGGEAAVDSLAVTYALKSAFERQRPLVNNYRGRFWAGGDSFPSEHAAAAWSIAGIIAHEYPGPLTSLFTYGLASLVSASRIDSKQHFPSDVLIGSTIGWLVGQHVYRSRHNPIVGGGEWETYAESNDGKSGHNSRSRGSPYVELDSWIYPALERLAALGYINNEFLAMRPWTRLECAELVEEAGDNLRSERSESSAANELYGTLLREFRAEAEVSYAGVDPSLHVESVYAGATNITGQPLNNSYHFGQTIINNFGRPYEQGFNSVGGFSGWSTAGRFTIYTRGEFQHAPSTPGYSDAVEDLMASLDGTAVQSTAAPAINQFRLLDTYLAAKVADWDLAFGKQSLWWGPAQGSALLFSNNAEPIYMFRASRIAPFTLPWIFHWLGPMKWDLFFGKLSGNLFPPRPFIHGEKISFKPTPNLELGFSRTGELGGVGRALTFGHLALSYFSLTSPNNETPDTDPGKRTGGFDLNYRVPFARNWFTVYLDSLADDDPSPLAAPLRAGINPGFYLTRFPKIPKLDLRVEGVNTDTPGSSNGGNYIYWDSFYRELYTNKNNLIGSWIGREGQGIQASSTYWFSSRSTLQFGYRHAKVASDFIPQGETLNDGSVTANWRLRHDLNLSALVQYEKWLAPVLAPMPQSNWTSSVQLSFQPHGFDLPLRSTRRLSTSDTADRDGKP
jgi:hypothetical protein